MVGRRHSSKSWYELKRNHPRELDSRDRRKLRDVPNAMQVDATASWPATAWIVATIYGSKCELWRDGRSIVSSVPKAKSGGTAYTLSVGDRVLFDEEHSAIAERLPRKSELVRMREDSQRRSPFAKQKHPLAVNIDIGIIVASKDDPPFHPRLIDRYMVMCQYGNVRPLICINKCDLNGDIQALEWYRQIGIPIALVSATTGEGLTELQSGISGYASVLVGHSGVGKSSIVNALLQQDVAVINRVSEKSGRGRHTTTTSSMHPLGPNTYVFDTPGIRSWGLWKIDKRSLPIYFPEFSPYAGQCRYRDCSHIVEPDCAVRAAAELRLIPSGRYASYKRLYCE